MKPSAINKLVVSYLFVMCASELFTPANIQTGAAFCKVTRGRCCAFYKLAQQRFRLLQSDSQSMKSADLCQAIANELKLMNYYNVDFMAFI